ncbi:hypothetical protein BAZ12_03710 [Elizabethkingia miricola]|uniref:DUF2845 domain-containing protein n=1 Tax=Elizabethkingia miricola TaxID=172045 RepID=A0ABD4DN66_ELIMR|nr:MULTISPECIES: hypothetical protein [Elizabethkingia]KUY19864.1 hypothetical protein ATB95_02720 [Elizabethkingia miricola]MCL1651510.1 hypothetical protein [Elizabethkingia miricola]OPC14150.1 hypothetical protein BAY01_07050 [Elizabethkingia miricola]OPC72910.1 hypothetical protein BAZ12_03710 [Elizabethkingia miricola]OPC73626.1 hypothetical protein BAZ13_00875 [Elizabethkingia miricola]
MKSRNLGLNILGIIGFCLFIISYFFYKEYQKKEVKTVQKNILNENFAGIIDSSFSDMKNHGWTTIIFKNKKSINGLTESINYNIKKNDSIVKRKGEDNIYIYRNGEVKAYKY